MGFRKMNHGTPDSPQPATRQTAQVSHVRRQGSSGHVGHKVHLAIVRKSDITMEAVPDKGAQSGNGSNCRIQKDFISYLRGTKRPQM